MVRSANSKHLALHAGCSCDSATMNMRVGTNIQVLDVGVEGGTHECSLELLAGTEVLVVSAYAVQGSMESDETTLPKVPKH